MISKPHLGLKFLLSLLMFFSLNNLSNAQEFCECNYELENPCSYEYILPVAPETDITDALQQALKERCMVRIPNYASPGEQTIYYVRPIVFSGTESDPNTAIEKRTLILDSGVVLEGITGAFSTCSQSIFTFDGNANKEIAILGKHDACDPYSIRPVIRMQDYSYWPFQEDIYLVASDKVGNPYLNNSGQPNYIFDDGDSDPYFDNSGNPNIIPPGSGLPKVPATADYNDYNCNRTIIAWNPRSWEARHAIALHGVQRAHIANLAITNITGDAIHITDDSEGNPTRRVRVWNMRFLDNGITATTISSGKCIWYHDCEFAYTGSILENNLNTDIETEGAVLLQEHLNPGSIIPGDIEMDSIKIENSTFFRNIRRGIMFDYPRATMDSQCDDHSDIILRRSCISHSEIGVDYVASDPAQLGRILFDKLSVSHCDTAVFVHDEWRGQQNLVWLDVNLHGNGEIVYEEPNSILCSVLDFVDLCTNPLIQLCGQQIDCLGSPQSCDGLFACEDDNPGGCDFEIEITEDTKIDCDCDFLFIVDESGSISPEEFANMEESITKTACEIGKCGGRVGLTHFNTSSRWAYGFSETPFCNLARAGFGGTNVGNAINFAVNELNDIELEEEFEYGEEGRCLHVFLHTDASCWQYNLQGSQLGELQDMATSVSVVFYDTNIYDEECHPALNEQIIDGEGGEFVFGFDDIDINLDDLIATFNLDLSIIGNCDPVNIFWSASNGGEILNSGSPNAYTVETNGEGIYQVEVVCSNGCIASEFFVYETDTTACEVPCDSILLDDAGRRSAAHYVPDDVRPGDEIKELDFNLDIYPNPFSDELFISTLSDESVEVRIFSIYGREMFKTILGSETPKQRILTSQWEAGVYFVYWIAPDGTEQQHKLMLVD